MHRLAERRRVCFLESAANNNQLILVSSLLTRCSAHNLIKLRIGNGLVRISAGWSESCWNLCPRENSNDLHLSLGFGFEAPTRTRTSRGLDCQNC